MMEAQGFAWCENAVSKQPLSPSSPHPGGGGWGGRRRSFSGKRHSSTGLLSPRESFDQESRPTFDGRSVRHGHKHVEMSDVSTCDPLSPRGLSRPFGTSLDAGPDVDLMQPVDALPVRAPHRHVPADMSEPPTLLSSVNPTRPAGSPKSQSFVRKALPTQAAPGGDQRSSVDAPQIRAPSKSRSFQGACRRHSFGAPAPTRRLSDVRPNARLRPLLDSGHETRFSQDQAASSRQVDSDDDIDGWGLNAGPDSLFDDCGFDEVRKSPSSLPELRNSPHIQKVRRRVLVPVEPEGGYAASSQLTERPKSFPQSTMKDVESGSDAATLLSLIKGLALDLKGPELRSLMTNLQRILKRYEGGQVPMSVMENPGIRMASEELSVQKAMKILQEAASRVRDIRLQQAPRRRSVPATTDPATSVETPPEAVDATAGGCFLRKGQGQESREWQLEERGFVEAARGERYGRNASTRVSVVDSGHAPDLAEKNSLKVKMLPRRLQSLKSMGGCPEGGDTCAQRSPQGSSQELHDGDATGAPFPKLHGTHGEIDEDSVMLEVSEVSVNSGSLLSSLHQHDDNLHGSDDDSSLSDSEIAPSDSASRVNTLSSF